MRWLGALVLLAACGGDKQADPKAAPLDAPVRRCKPDPACEPPRPTPGRTCSVGGWDITCDRCGANGGLEQCEDLDHDGCAELIRTECGRRDDSCVENAQGAACKPMTEALNRFGFRRRGQELPGGFVDCGQDLPVPVEDDKIAIVVRTRATFRGAVKWAIAVKGGGLDRKLSELSGYSNVIDDWVTLQEDVSVEGFDRGSPEVDLIYTVEDELGQKLEQTCHTSLTFTP